MISYTILEGSTRICNEFIYERTATSTFIVGGANDGQTFTVTDKTIEFEKLNKFCDYTYNSTYILNFIGQEIGREVNTIGSKANDAEMQKMVVHMKDELEKIKEQTNNVL